MTRKVMRPKAWDPKKQKFPCWSEPKIDGARGVNFDGTLTARTQKKHKNRFVTAQFSKPEYIGFDGELAGAHECDQALCRITSSVLGTIEGEPFVLWHIFDYVTPLNAHLPYAERYAQAKARIEAYQAQRGGQRGQLRLVPYVVCNNLADVEAAHQKWMAMGYEGSCVWNPALPHKEGDSSATHGGVNRIKDFVDSEARIIDVIEGDTNLNEAQINELGRTFRTSHQENKSPNGMVGCLVLQQIEDLFDPYDKKKILIAKDQIFNCSPGAMTHPERVANMRNPHMLLQQIAKFKFFPKGMKDAPRFAQFMSVRSVEDL